MKADQHILEALIAAPQAAHTRLAVAFAAQEAAQFGHAPDEVGAVIDCGGSGRLGLMWRSLSEEPP